MTELKTIQVEAIGNWLLNEDTGMSSLTVAGVLLGGNPQEPRHPYDPDDFSRVYTLVKMVPDGDKLFIERMYHIDAHWRTIVENWHELCALFEEERLSGKAPKLYARMKQLGL